MNTASQAPAALLARNPVQVIAGVFKKFRWPRSNIATKEVLADCRYTTGSVMLVQHILDEARRRLAVLSWDAPVIAAATILANRNTPLVVVCDSAGVAIGVVTSTDIVKLFSRGEDDAFATNAGGVMTQPVFSCREEEALQFVWEGLSERSLRCAPILDEFRRPRGIIHARDVARALLEEVTHEELLLRDYVLGVGYR